MDKNLFNFKLVTENQLPVLVVKLYHSTCSLVPRPFSYKRPGYKAIPLGNEGIAVETAPHATCMLVSRQQIKHVIVYSCSARWTADVHSGENDFCTVAGEGSLTEKRL